MSKSDKREAAGFILYRLNDDEVAEFLLMRNAKLGHWGFAKGHRDEDDEDLLECAVRELAEETAIEDVLMHSGFREEVRYTAERKGKKYKKRVVYFLAWQDGSPIELSDEHDAAEWFGAAKARVLLKFENLVALFDNACEYLETVCKVPCGKDLE